MRRNRRRKRSALQVNQEITKSIRDSWLIVWVMGLFFVLPNVFWIILGIGGVLSWVILLFSSVIVIQAILRIRRLKKIRKALFNNPELASTLRVDAAPDLGNLIAFWR